MLTKVSNQESFNSIRRPFSIYNIVILINIEAEDLGTLSLREMYVLVLNLKSGLVPNVIVVKTNFRELLKPALGVVNLFDPILSFGVSSL